MIMSHPFRDGRSFSLQIALMNHEISGMICETYGNIAAGLRRLKSEKNFFKAPLSVNYLLKNFKLQITVDAKI